ncbi:hypothetical protein BFJ67_g16843 [Fusarium oxysporum f. sp. cepae]|nr:hypothetical protein BFJ67_g16843 [Fusarium oxysporum f. sp. cepae]
MTWTWGAIRDCLTVFIRLQSAFGHDQSDMDKQVRPQQMEDEVEISQTVAAIVTVIEMTQKVCETSLYEVDCIQMMSLNLGSTPDNILGSGSALLHRE